MSVVPLPASPALSLELELLVVVVVVEVLEVPLFVSVVEEEVPEVEFDAVPEVAAGDVVAGASVSVNSSSQRHSNNRGITINRDERRSNDARRQTKQTK